MTSVSARRIILTAKKKKKRKKKKKKKKKRRTTTMAAITTMNKTSIYARQSISILQKKDEKLNSISTEVYYCIVN